MGGSRRGLRVVTGTMEGRMELKLAKTSERSKLSASTRCGGRSLWLRLIVSFGEAPLTLKGKNVCNCVIGSITFTNAW